MSREGGTNDSDHSESPSMRKCLRKTRGELLLREYEEEIEGLIRENEELKTKNQSLEAQLKKVLDPCSVSAAQTNDKSVDPYVLEEWMNKLRTAREVGDKIKQDMDKLKEANKALRSQNMDLVQENMRLKAEVASRSPQKFGRYTVAALEAKIQQYERNVDQLKKALERSDQYIEDLESRVNTSEKRHVDTQEAHGGVKAASESLTQQQKINMMMRSLSDNERELICSNPEAECGTFSRNHTLAFMPSPDHKESDKNLTSDQKYKDLDSGSSDFLPTTPSSAFRSLTLRSPGIREKKVAFKPGSYLRRLDFEDFPSTSAADKQFDSNLDKIPKALPPGADVDPSKSSVFWGGWSRSNSDDQTRPEQVSESSVKRCTSTEADSFQMSSEASMDAAYLDKISELDSMMLDGESSSSREHNQKNHPACDETDAAASERTSPQGSDDEGAQVSGGGVGGEGSSHTDELSFDLLFDTVEENKPGPSGSLSPSDKDDDGPSSMFSGGKPVSTSRDRHTVAMSQPTKRKSHSPFNTSSPTKLSKL
ncbi:hypothetical protein INR49_016353, partial [Caranx melampygus]